MNFIIKKQYGNIFKGLFISFIVVVKFMMLSKYEPLYAFDKYFHAFDILFIIVLAYFILSFLFEKWKVYKQLKNEKTKAELSLLKSKINPHFLFNTLNNLYGLVIKKSDEAPQFLLKLSEILRYTIYEGGNEIVLLKDEINYLEQYIEIHKIRYNKKVNISFKKVIEDENTEIAPLLFIMLLENAFKHGAESLTNNAFIKITLIAKGNKITFIIENNYEPKHKKEKGIGLENLKHRLKLIYPKRHELLLTKKEKIYNAQLNIKLQ